MMLFLILFVFNHRVNMRLGTGKTTMPFLPAKSTVYKSLYLSTRLKILLRPVTNLV